MNKVSVPGSHLFWWYKSKQVYKLILAWGNWYQRVAKVSFEKISHAIVISCSVSENLHCLETSKQIRVRYSVLNMWHWWYIGVVNHKCNFSVFDLKHSVNVGNCKYAANTWIFFPTYTLVMFSVNCSKLESKHQGYDNTFSSLIQLCTLGCCCKLSHLLSIWSGDNECSITSNLIRNPPRSTIFGCKNIWLFKARWWQFSGKLSSNSFLSSNFWSQQLIFLAAIQKQLISLHAAKNWKSKVA